MSLRIYARLSRFVIIFSDTFDKYLSLQICKRAPLTQANSITSVSQPSPKCQTWASYYGVSDVAALARDTHKFECRAMSTGWSDPIRRRKPVIANARLLSRGSAGEAGDFLPRR